MKNFIPALVAALLASLLTVVLVQVLDSGDAVQSGSESLTPGDGLALAAGEGTFRDLGPESLTGGERNAQVIELEMRVASLESRLAGLTDTRQPVVTDEMREQIASMSDPEARDFVLDVLAQKEEDERLQREAERRQRNEERLLAEAGKIAENVGLAGGQKDVLFGVLLEEDARRNAMFETMREGNFGPQNRDSMREQMQLIGQWKAQELTDKLGADAADQIKKYQDENNRGRGRGGMGGFGGDRGGGGRGGGRGGG